MRQASDRGFDSAIVVDCIGAHEAADLYGVSASTMRKAIFSAATHSDAVHAWIAKRSSGSSCAQQTDAREAKRRREA